MRNITKSIAMVAALIMATSATQASEPLTQESLKQVGLNISKPAPYQMLTITVANFQVELCGIPATDTEPVRLVRKELCEAK
jgi:hypothetical protein